MGLPFRILGAGPAGLSAAITAAQAGTRVEVYDIKEACGERFHGDFQCLENWSEDRSFLDIVREWGFDLRGLCAIPFTETDVIGPHGEFHTARSHRPAVHVVRRGTHADSLDQSLYRSALNAGVQFYFGRTIAPERCHVIATGPRRPTGYVTGFLFATSQPDRTSMLLSRRVAPGGYGYLICTRGRGLVAATVLERGKPPAEHRRAVLDAFQRRYGKLVNGSVQSFGGYGQFGLVRSFRFQNAYLAGESAGLQDALWGFGIRTAMISGRLAALAHLDGFDYTTALESKVLGQARTSLINRWAYEFAQDTLSAALVQAWKVEQRIRGDGLPFIQRLYRPDPLRWRLLGRVATRRLRNEDESIRGLPMRRGRG